MSSSNWRVSSAADVMSPSFRAVNGLLLIAPYNTCSYILSLYCIAMEGIFWKKKKKKETRIIKVLFSCYYITIWIGTESPICNALINFIWNFNILPSLSPGHSNFLRQASSNSCHIRWWSSARFDYQMLLPKKKVSKRLWIWL